MGLNPRDSISRVYNSRGKIYRDSISWEPTQKGLVKVGPYHKGTPSHIDSHEMESLEMESLKIFHLISFRTVLLLSVSTATK